MLVVIVRVNVCLLLIIYVITYIAVKNPEQSVEVDLDPFMDFVTAQDDKADRYLDKKDNTNSQYDQTEGSTDTENKNTENKDADSQNGPKTAHSGVPRTIRNILARRAWRNAHKHDTPPKPKNIKRTKLTVIREVNAKYEKSFMSEKSDKNDFNQNDLNKNDSDNKDG